MKENEEHWDLVVKPKYSLFDLHLADLWRYKDLIMLFVRRDIIATYKQTILGPLWFIIQPLMMTLIYTLVFGRVANIPTDGVEPPMMFFLSGVILWNYFSTCLTKTANTFVANAGMFGKVYFPRLTVPVSVMISNLVSMSIQLGLFVVLSIYFALTGSSTIHITAYILLLPILIVLLAILSLGMGIIISALTTKYRDLSYFLGFGVQLLMFATPVVYPSSFVSEKYRWIIQFNPIAPIIDCFRSAYFGTGLFDWAGLAYTSLFSIITLAIGVVLFNKVEKTFMDTV